MKKLNKKTILLIALSAILLVGVSGTLAYLITDTEPVINTFTPSEVKTEIEEPDWDNKTKSTVIVKNTGSVDVFVRVAVTGNWVKDITNEDGEVIKTVIVEPWTESIPNSSAWKKFGDYYYYTKVVKAEDDPATTDVDERVTSNLLSKSITMSKREDGSYLQLTILHQSIQAVPDDVVIKTWGVDPTTLK